MGLTTSVQTAKDRLTAMQKIAVPGAESASYASFTGTYDNFYWLNYLSPIAAPARTYGGRMFTFNVQVQSRLVTGYITEDYDGVREDELNFTHIPAVLEYFYQRPYLTYDETTDKIPHLNAEAFALSCTGTRIFNHSSGQVFGTEFTFSLSFDVGLEITKG